MNDDFEDRLTQRLADRAAQARPAPDLDSIAAGLHRLEARPPVAPGRRRRLLAVAALAVLVVGGTIAVRLADREPATRFRTAPTARTECSLFLFPGRDDALIAEAGAELRERGDVTDLRFVDQSAAYEEFRRLFAEKPDLVDSVASSVLPVSWRFVTAIPAAQIQADLRAAFPGADATCTDATGR